MGDPNKHFSAAEELARKVSEASGAVEKAAEIQQEQARILRLLDEMDRLRKELEAQSYFRAAVAASSADTIGALMASGSAVESSMEQVRRAYAELLAAHGKTE